MAEERTISCFMRTDTRDRANQDARAIIAQTKIYQHNQYEAHKASKTPKQSKSPLLMWQSVKSLFELKTPTPAVQIDLTGDSASQADKSLEVVISSECEAGLAALDSMNDDDRSDHVPPPDSVSPSTLSLDCDGVDICLPIFRDLLSDKPLEGADTIHSLGEWPGDHGLDIGTAGKAAGIVTLVTGFDSATKFTFHYKIPATRTSKGCRNHHLICYTRFLHGEKIVISQLIPEGSGPREKEKKCKIFNPHGAPAVASERYDAQKPASLRGKCLDSEKCQAKLRIGKLVIPGYLHLFFLRA
ncbi:hypothetical protein DFH08DRAFT_820651 [Mycena albidolilacea]|uniref:Uncharacterized protein n=1 Tax=Mycena albidolilacea TaxID=1033008 RepID=A0AAD6ZBR9_9AGAR|nr:hypothetical protein DFH08DRAFT_820651 [Mycena albidolilacea]